MVKAKSKVPIGIVLVASVLILLGGIFAFKANAYPSSVFTQASATSVYTQSFMSAGVGTTTYQLDATSTTLNGTGKVLSMQGIDASSLYILFNASTSVSILAWQIQYSNDNLNWYGESATLATAGTNVASSTTFAGQAVMQESTSTVTHVWTPNASGTSTKAVLLPATPALHERVVFSIPAGSSGGALYNEVDLKQNPSGH